MKYSIYIDQLTLSYWQGKIDAVDCLIIGFINDLNPDNPGIKKHMWRGHFQIQRSWLIDEMPMLGVSEQTLYRRLRHLRELGILDKINRQIDGEGIRTNAYFKLSKDFWKIHAKRHKNITESIKDDTFPVVTHDYGTENPRSHLRESPSSPMTSNESTRDSVTSSQGAAALDGTPKREGKEKKDSAAVKCKCGLEIPRDTADGCMNCSRPFPGGMNGRDYLDSLAEAATG